MADFLEGSALAGAISALIDTGVGVRCAVAFWSPALAERARQTGARVVLDISMGCTTKNALRSLGVPEIDGDSKTVKVLEDFHAKIYIADGVAIVASANASTNALGSGGSRPRLKEAGVRLDALANAAAYDAACEHFEQLHKRGANAGPEHIAKAPELSPTRSARDPAANDAFGSSVLSAVQSAPERFEHTCFIFGDRDVSASEYADARDAYDEQIDPGTTNRVRKLICLTTNKTDIRIIEQSEFVIMYWLGSGLGIKAYSDIVCVNTQAGAVFFGRQQWSVVRAALNIQSTQHLTAFWQADHERAEKLAGLLGSTLGDRFVILRSKQVYSELEREY